MQFVEFIIFNGFFLNTNFCCSRWYFSHPAQYLQVLLKHHIPFHSYIIALIFAKKKETWGKNRRVPRKFCFPQVGFIVNRIQRENPWYNDELLSVGIDWAYWAGTRNNFNFPLRTQMSLSIRKCILSSMLFFDFCSLQPMQYYNFFPYSNFYVLSPFQT